jgi:hypothetical protein
MRKRRRLYILSVVLIASIIGGILLESLGVFDANVANAQAVTISYANGVSLWDGNVYSANSQMDGHISIDAGAGYIIDEAYYMEKGQKVAIPEAVGQQTWTGTKTISGETVHVTSKNNESTQGYYAWYRYTPGDPHGVNWYEQGGSCPPSPISEDTADGMCTVGSPVAYENVNGTMMPVAPGVIDHNLGLDGTVEKPYLTVDTGIHIPDEAVAAPQPTDFHPTVDAFTEINGPNGIRGTTAPVPTEIRVGNITDSKHFRIFYAQDFSSLIDSQTQNLGLPGAKLTVYFAAFKINVDSVSYKYPSQAFFTVKPAAPPKKPDYTPDYIQAVGNVNLASPTMFEYKMDNAGVAANKQSIMRIVDMSNGYVIVEKTVDPLPEKGSHTGTFSYTFTSPGQKRLAFYVDVSNAIDEENESNNYKPFEFFVNVGITGDFDITPDTIQFRDSFTLTPKNFDIPSGCTYKYHEYKFDNNGTSYSGSIQGQSKQTTFNYPNYPSAVVIGTTIITINVVADCGGYGVVSSGYMSPHPLTMNPSNRPNNPPVFEAGFFRYGDNSGINPIYEVVQDDYVNLRIIHDNSQDPAHPYDPENDPFSFEWDFAGSSSAWIRSIPSTYGFDNREESFTRIKATDLGFHQIKVTATDIFGAYSTKTAYLQVVPPNPVPDAVCPAETKSGRPIPASAFNADNSYSPVNGRTIDHTKDEWTNKQSSYINNTGSDITVYASLHVYDNTGLKSIDPDTCSITVHPDLPPVGDLKATPIAIRNQNVYVQNKSYSPDGDALVSAQYFYKYDWANNGFGDDGWNALSGGDLNGINFTPPKVGKYLFCVRVTEDYGKQGDNCSSEGPNQILDVVNNAPSVSFEVLGKNKEPDQQTIVSYSADTMLNNWNLFAVNSNTLINDRKTRAFSVENGKLRAGSGRDYWAQNQYWSGTSIGYTNYSYRLRPPDNGYGSTSKSPWRSMVQYKGATYLSDPTDPSKVLTYDWPFPDTARPKVKLQANEKYIFINKDRGIYAANKQKILEGRTNYWDFSFITFTKQGNYRMCKTYTGGGDDSPVFEGPPYACGNGDVITPDLSTSFAVADETLYVHVEIRGEAHRWNGYPYYDSIYGIAALDAYTGEFKAIFPEAPTKTEYRGEYFTEGDNLVVVSLGSFYGSNNFAGVIKINSKGQEIFRKTMDTMCPINYGGNGTGLFKISDNEYMWYEHCGPKEDFGYGRETGNLYITKFDANFNVVWRQKTRGSSPSPYIWPEIELRPDNPRSYEMSNVIVPIPSQDKVMVRSFYNYYTSDLQTIPSGGAMEQHFRLSDGALLWQSPDYSRTYYPNNPPIIQKWDGTVITGQQGEILADGVIEYESSVSDSSARMVNSYFGDGIKIQSQNYFPPGQSYGKLAFYVMYGEFNQNYVHNPYQLGQFVSPNDQADFDMSGSINIKDTSLDTKLAGLSFRMADPMNRYAVETDGSNVFLSKYVGGVRTVLASQNYLFQNGTTYPIRIVASGANIQVWVNSVPFFNVNDSTFANGKFGYFTDKPFVSFRAISIKQVVTGPTSWVTNYAIWEPSLGYAEVQYKNITFTDPENDPQAGNYQWRYAHTPKFLNNQGYSARNGQTYTSPQVTLDKVGDYYITLNAQDDPNPDFRYPSNNFAGYRKWSNDYTVKVTAHRRPIAQFSLYTNGDGSIGWDDTSYDPDRYAPYSWDPHSGTCDAPDTTGINYCANRGILERIYWYFAPDGTRIDQKLVYPAQGPGTYTAYEQVVDEYGAKSTPASYDMYVSCGCFGGNTPPTATITNPTGSQSNPTLVYTTRPQISLYQSDPDAGTIFKAYRIRILNEDGSPTGIESGEVPEWNGNYSTVYWNVPADLIRGKKYQVIGAAFDGQAWSAWSPPTWMVINSPPSVTITSPNGLTKDAPMMIFDNKRPTVSWVQSDRERGYFSKFYLEVLDQNGGMVYNTGWGAFQNTWSTTNGFTIPVDLPTNVPLQVHMMVTDDDVNLWSGWSNTVWFFIDQTPTATMTVPSGTQANPTPMSPTPTITFIQSDPDPNPTFTKYQVQFINEANTVVLWDSGIMSQNASGPSSSVSYSIPAASPLPAGVKVQVRARTYDGYTWSNWSNRMWLLTNRPPTADFAWSPNPAFEGDTVTLINQSSDPDGDVLTFVWTITVPGGFSLPPQTTQNAVISGTITDNLPGVYDIALTVCDPFNACAEAGKSLTVGDLTIQGFVKHFDKWNEHRQIYNTSKTGDPELPRPYDMYWAGEGFRLEAVTSHPAASVTVKMSYTGVSADLHSVDGVHWSGEMQRDDFERLPDGDYTFTFTGAWANGHAESAVKTIQIKDPWTDYTDLVRKY